MESETDTPGRPQRAKEVLEDILSYMPMDASVVFREEEDRVLLNIESADHQLLIGKGGQTLDSIQFIVSRIVGRTHPGSKRIVVDCEGYRERRAEQLRRMGNQVAEKVREEKIPYAFDASLTAAERRIIHMELRGQPGILTRSEGEDDQRRLVVLPQADDDE
jgi:spoIIIJ-associated protein